MLKAGYGLIRDSARIFLEAAPVGVDPDALGDRLAAQDTVVEIHDLHVWQITSGQNALSAHVLVQPGKDCHAVRRTLRQLLQDEYRIEHATLQVDHVGEEDNSDLLQITTPPGGDEDPHCDDSHGPVHRSGPHDH